MGEHEGQLRLTPTGDSGEQLKPDVIAVEWPDRFHKLRRRLSPGAALAFAMRAPVVLLELLEELVALGQLPDGELDARRRRAKMDLDRLTAEQERRLEERQQR